MLRATAAGAGERTILVLEQRLPLAFKQAAPIVGGVVLVAVISAAVLLTRPHGQKHSMTLQVASVRLAPGHSPTQTAVVREGGGMPVTVSAGDYSACAVLADRTVACWGHNAHGQLGNGTRVSRPGATPVAGLRSVAAVSVGGSHACALLRSGAVECWGANAHGELGDGTTR